MNRFSTIFCGLGFIAILLSIVIGLQSQIYTTGFPSIPSTGTTIHPATERKSELVHSLFVIELVGAGFLIAGVGLLLTGAFSFLAASKNQIDSGNTSTSIKRRPGVDTSVAVFSGFMLAIFFLFFVFWKLWEARATPATYIVVAIIICWLLAIWKTLGRRTFALILASALGTIASSLMAYQILTSLSHPDPLADWPGQSAEFVSQCKPNEVRVTCLSYPQSSRTYKTMRAVDLATGKWRSIGEWADGIGQRSNISSEDAGFQPFTVRQLEIIKTLVSELPSPQWKFFAEKGAVEQQSHVSFFHDGKLQTYDYATDEGGDKYYRLLEALSPPRRQ